MINNIIYFLLSGLSIDFLIQCLISILMGGFISFILIISGQKWAASFNNICTYAILPLVGLVITTVISKNLGLALGMVGALSVIRFRHPVKSPLELTIYFLLLTIGITLPNSIGKSIALTFFSMSTILVVTFYRSKLSKSQNSFPKFSFIRENPEFILDIKCFNKKQELANSEFLLFSYENQEESIFEYKLAFGNKYDADTFKRKLENIKDIKEIKFTCI